MKYINNHTKYIKITQHKICLAVHEDGHHNIDFYAAIERMALQPSEEKQTDHQS